MDLPLNLPSVPGYIWLHHGNIDEVAEVTGHTLEDLKNTLHYFNEAGDNFVRIPIPKEMSQSCVVTARDTTPSPTP